MTRLFLLFVLAFTKANYYSKIVKGHIDDMELINENDIDVPVPGNIAASETDNIFRYIAAILLFEHFISTGALINDRWVITAAQHLYTNRDHTSNLSARFGSVDYDKSGLLISISAIQLHPYYRFGYPGYDMALLRLSEVIITSFLKPLNLPTAGVEMNQSNFYVASWSLETLDSTINLAWHSRSLKFRRLYLSGVEKCYKYLDSINHYVDSKESTRCFSSSRERHSCAKDSGVPVVSQGILWGIASSYIHDDCETKDTPTLVTMATAPDIQVWLNTVIKTPSWTNNVQNIYFASMEEGPALLGELYV